MSTTNKDLLARRNNAVPRGVSTSTPVFTDRAENAELWDVEGRRYVDFAGGIAVLNVGHRHPKVMAAVAKQLERFTHTAFQVSAYESYIELAEKLNARAPFSGPAKTIFFTTGGEATENAVKIARAATGRNGVIAFCGGFHGRTLLASAMTGKVLPYKAPFGTLPGEVYHVPFPDHDITVEDSLKMLHFLFAADIAPSNVAAIIIESVQGEGGFRVAPPALLRHLRALCDQHGIKLIADEVQSGFGRTGKLFGIEHSGVEPDLISVAKSLAGGLPLSGVIGRADLMDSVPPGGLGGTYAGAPLACAAALAVLDVIDEEKLLDRANAMGERLKARMTAWHRRTDMLPISMPRGLGAMIAFDILERHAGVEQRVGFASKLCARACEKGLILLACGVQGATIRILTPLTASDALLDEGLDIIEQILIEEAKA
ncbi:MULTISPECIES: 4-aminobutyrate--2-oxoglutarate transaminase [Acetobacter]|jgi:4-aminobutyrate aminotransferase/(S)-3-amino-2-methylpropionate transaminase|uniref:4-aminobutyrate aminotransferase/(S)-3-amino-2-methylpropionate transaminase n=1 Tax=Acetobacter lovaniensis TaxID=104100 RepID=A0A841QJ19_9PROT|nr:4-aminobutyrate--2-oxoglutarate transaminase [Acetobacter lovaniensis]MBB6458590.1 4-aminobutyrate aminotransferase/(S)-3-amino-2-methylpropionate transaminase [Acetobacter lovaniensis]MCI1698917.1 4-aminobutyrate--2-oxoglutarate transaminase [Acetobacter lovaniensis]MCP1240775.1 4-aminobutyrate--2-oxoglutarate transaminase [Acetobacter lovaniensis]NHN82764.1 4-aminobutyrate--2-oxoglutarate transaminase [Acetobacter lovaniensis]GBQ65170.1 4-aminobutyrate aminotransferase [Acetobacter lovani